MSTNKHIELIHDLNLAFAATEQQLTGEITALTQREQEVAAQLLTVQQQAEEQRAELARSHSEQERALRHQYAERETTLHQQLQAGQQELQRLQLELAQMEKGHAEQASQTRKELETLLRHQVQREQEVAAQLLQAQQQAEREKTELAHRHAEHATALQQQYAEREQALQQKLQALQAQLDRLQQERAARETLLHEQNSQSRQELERLLRQLVQREQEVAAQLLQAQQQAEREKTELAHRHAEHATALQRQHDVELRTKLGEHQCVLDACAALQTELKAQVLLEQQASLQLRQSLAEMQHQLGMVHTSLSWRLTAPLRKLASCIAPERVSAAAFPCKDTPSTPAQQAAAMRQAIDLPMTTSCLEPEIAPATLATHVQAPDSAMVPQTPGQPVAAALSINDLRLATESSFTTSFAPVNMTLTPALVAASTLDELLGQHDQSFIQCAYLTLLGREPDPEGLNYYLSRLRTGYLKIQILAQLRLSNEGRTYAAKLPGLDTAIQRHQRGRYPLIGWLFRRLNDAEGNNPTERKLRGIENQIFMLSDESNRRFNQLETTLAGLQHLVVQQIQSVVAAPGSTPVVIPSASSPVPIQSPEPDRLKQLSPHARTIYFQLKAASAIYAGRTA